MAPWTTGLSADYEVYVTLEFSLISLLDFIVAPGGFRYATLIAISYLGSFSVSRNIYLLSKYFK